MYILYIKRRNVHATLLYSVFVANKRIYKLKLHPTSPVAQINSGLKPAVGLKFGSRDVWS